MMNSFLKFIKPLLSTALLATVFIFIDLKSTVDCLLYANILLVIAGVLIGNIVIMIRTCRWFVLLRGQGFNYSFIESLRSFYISMFYSLILPARAGELGKAFFLGEADNHKKARITVSVIADRIWDMGVLAILGLSAAMTMSEKFQISIEKRHLLMIFGLIAAVIASVYAMRKSIFRIFIVKLERRIGVAEDMTSNLIDEGLMLMRRYFIQCLMLTFLAWGAYIFMAFVFAQSLSLNMGIGTTTFFVAIGALMSVVPVTVSGAGTRDSAFACCFKIMGQMPEKAVAFSFLFLLMNIVLGITGWIINFYASSTKILEGRQ